MARFSLNVTINYKVGEDYDSFICKSRKAVAKRIGECLTDPNATSFMFTVARVAKSTGGDQSGGGSEQEG